MENFLHSSSAFSLAKCKVVNEENYPSAQPNLCPSHATLRTGRRHGARHTEQSAPSPGEGQRQIVVCGSRETKW